MARVTSVIRDDARQIVARVGQPRTALAGTTVLLTGAGGFLGSYLLDVLTAYNEQADRPCRIIAVDSFLVGLPERVAHLRENAQIRFLQHDVSQSLPIGEGVDWIVHAASIASPTFYRGHPLETIDVNVQGTRHLLEFARQRGVRSFLFLSSSEIYGDPSADAIPTPETYRGYVSCTGPRACYDESKRLGETLCATYFRLHRTPVKTIRPFNVYGPGQRLDDKRIIPDLMDAALRRRPIVLHSDGRATRAFCYIADFLTGLLLVLLSDRNGEAFNVGNDEEVSIQTVAELAAALPAPPPIPLEFRPSAESDYLTDNPQRRCPALLKMRSTFPWEPTVRIAEGLSRTFRSYQEDLAGGT